MCAWRQKKLHKSSPLMPSPYSCNKRKGYTVQTIRKFDSRGALRCLHTCAILKFSVKVFINMIDIPLENTKYVSWSVISYHPKIVLSRDVWWGKLGPQTACLPQLGPNLASHPDTLCESEQIGSPDWGLPQRTPTGKQCSVPLLWRDQVAAGIGQHIINGGTTDPV